MRDSWCRRFSFSRFYFFTFALRYDKGWMIYCWSVNCQRTGKELPKNRKNNKKKKNKEKTIRRRRRRSRQKNASLKLDRLRHNNSLLWEKKPSFNNVISKRHTHKREAKSAISFNSKWCSRCRFLWCRLNLFRGKKAAVCSNTTQLKISHNATMVKRRLESSVTIWSWQAVYQ